MQNTTHNTNTANNIVNFPAQVSRTFDEKIEAFRAQVEAQVRAEFDRKGYTDAVHERSMRVTVKAGRKYTKVDVGDSGRYMVEMDTERIFGIKGYGVVHRGKAYGTLDLSLIHI